MLSKTKGIVFKYIKYRESSIIATILTENFGIQSYIINSVRSKKPRFSIALFQPLTLLDMVVYHKENATLNRVSELRCEHHFASIPYQHNKTAITLFLSEVLYKAIRLESHPEGVFQFIYHSILSLDLLDQKFENFHLQFLLKLTRYLGFYPESGTELKSQLVHGDNSLESEIDSLINSNYDQFTVGLNSSLRITLLDHILDFYDLHIENLGNIYSYKILREVLHS
ncbi:MAG: recombination protein O N-terminal domain-containing protein [Bacteroidetes bacterium]|nr:recombination protein O N-terminal domain-containing protein [Bacteroidota bacterium]